MIAIKAPKLSRLQTELKSAPALYRRAAVRAISTTRRDTKADATKIAQTIYTAGRNKISAAMTTSTVDKQALSFKLRATNKGISLVDFEHRGSVSKRRRGASVRVRVLRAGGYSMLQDSFKKRGSITGKMRIMQFQRSGPQAVIALASSSVADMLNRPAVYDRLADFSNKKMSNELARQIALVFK
jgi:hypothetical protein